MDYREFGDTYIVRIDRGEEILSSLTALCDKDLLAHGGHANELRVSATCEMVVRTIPGEVDRKLDDQTGLNVFMFS